MDSPRASKRRKVSNNPMQASSYSNPLQENSIAFSGSISTKSASRPTRTYGKSRKSYGSTSLPNGTGFPDEDSNGDKTPMFADSAYQSRTTSRTTPEEPEVAPAGATPSRTLRSGKQAAIESGRQESEALDKGQVSLTKKKIATKPPEKPVKSNRVQTGPQQSRDGATSRHSDPAHSDTIVVRDSSPLGEAIEATSKREPLPTQRSSGRIRRQINKAQEVAAEKPAGRKRPRTDDPGLKKNKNDDNANKDVEAELGSERRRRRSQRLEPKQDVDREERPPGEVQEVAEENDEESEASDDGEPTFGELLGIHDPVSTSTTRLLNEHSIVSPRKKRIKSTNNASSPIPPLSIHDQVEDLAQIDNVDANPSRRVASSSSRSKGKGKGKAKASLDTPLEDSPSLPARSPANTIGPSSTQLLQDRLQKDSAAPKQLEAVKTRILERLTGKQRLPLHGLGTEYQKVHQLLLQTVVAGEGNSMLLIGPRGSAKTNLVETALARIGAQHRDDFLVVRLNGFIHTDDKLALKEIWRQLGREMDVENDTAPSSYADNLASILALLSHPTELAEDPSSAAMDVDSAPTTTAQSVIFVINEFDLFTAHARQTLLYNLFDIAQARKAPIAVLGLTTKLDVIDSLEKRVKSRFSHRYVYISLPKSLPAFKEICMAALDGAVEEEEPSTTDCNNPFGVRALDLGRRKKMSGATFASEKTLPDLWRAYIAALFAHDTALNQLLSHIYATTKSVPSFLSAALLPILALTPSTLPTGASFLSAPLFAPDSKLDLLPSLSFLELALLIAGARLDVILDVDTCNFNMAYDEYVALAEKAKVVSSSSGAAALGGGVGRVWGRGVALGAWEGLGRVELLVPATGGGGAGGGGGDGGTGKAGRLWKVDVGLEEIGESGVEMSAVLRRWCREI